MAPAVIDGNRIVHDFTLEKYLNKKEVVLFFYPKDFTYICPTELLELQENLAAFQSRSVAIIACSTDSEEVHRAWLSTPRNKGGIEGVSYPIIADSSKMIATSFGVLAGEWGIDEKQALTFEGEAIAYRGTFFIDKKGVIRHESINDLPLGRNIQEILRIVDMWHHTQLHGNVCPVNWKKGDQGLAPTPQGVASYLIKSTSCACDKTKCND